MLKCCSTRDDNGNDSNDNDDDVKETFLCPEQQPFFLELKQEENRNWDEEEQGEKENN
jgi:hypothetical protein